MCGFVSRKTDLATLLVWRQVWNLLGLCRTSMGDIQGGVAAYKRAIALAPDFREAWLNLAQARKEARYLLAPAHACLNPECVHPDMAWAMQHPRHPSEEAAAWE